MRKLGLALLLMLIILVAVPSVQARSLIRDVPVAAPGTLGTAPSGAVQVTLGASGTYTLSLNFTIHVVSVAPAHNIQALFILNHTSPTKLAGAPIFTETGEGSPDTGIAGHNLTPHGPYTNTFWAYSVKGGVGPDCVFPKSPCTNGVATSYYNYSYVWTGPLTGPLNAWKLINVTFTIPAGSVSTTNPAAFIIVGAGNSMLNGADLWTDPYVTPWSGATNIIVIPEFEVGTILAVILPLVALAVYLRPRGASQLGAAET